jgi:hypothetical protein
MTIRIGIGKTRIGTGQPYVYFDGTMIESIFEFLGTITNITGGKLYNEVRGKTDYLTVGGTAGNYTFQCPQTAAYKNADTDYIWIKKDGTTWRTASEAALVAWDLQRTPTQYDAAAPNLLRKIGILKAGVTLTAKAINELHKMFLLPIYWAGTLNAYGQVKSNRTGQSLWTPEAVAPNGNCTALTLTVISDTQINLAWANGSNNEEGISIERSTDSVTFAEIHATASGAVSYPNTGLTLGLHYYYRVRAVREGLYTNYATANAWTTVSTLIGDGQTVGQYIADDLATITKDGSNYVSQWNDKLGSGHNLTGSGTAKPLWSADGVLFDGSNDLMQSTFTLVQPEYIYAVLRIKRSQLYDMALDGKTYQTAALGQMAAGYLSCTCLYGAGHELITLDAWMIVRVLITSVANGGKLTKDAAAPALWASNPSGDMGGLTLGASGAGVYNGNSEFKEVIVRNVKDSAAQELAIYNYLKNKYGL